MTETATLSRHFMLGILLALRKGQEEIHRPATTTLCELTTRVRPAHTHTTAVYLKLSATSFPSGASFRSRDCAPSNCSRSILMLVRRSLRRMLDSAALFGRATLAAAAAALPSAPAARPSAAVDCDGFWRPRVREGASQRARPERGSPEKTSCSSRQVRQQQLRWLHRHGPHEQKRREHTEVYRSRKMYGRSLAPRR